jgi:hypothetical protein
VRDLAAVGFCALEARAWADKLLSRAEEGARKSGLRYDPVSVDWTIDPALSGRRVLLRGLPGGIQHKDVYNVAGAAVDVAANRPVRRLPPQQWSNVSSWAITTPSVSHAHELVRRLHMNYFFNDRDFLMRADVVW